MADRQKVQLSLSSLLESCKAAIILLSDPGQANSPPEFATIRIDFLSLLSLVHSASTKVALVLKPSSDQYKAALPPLQDLSKNVAALVHSIHLFRQHQGSTVLKEYETVARNIINAIESLAQTLLSNHSNPGVTTEDYLVRTGAIHDIVEHARKAGGLSLNNLDAVRKCWLRDHDSLLDAAEELKEICAPPSVDDFDDGWEELGLGPDENLSPPELERAGKVQTAIKLVVLLHERVLRDLLVPHGRMTEDNSIIDLLVIQSNNLLSASDDLISSMYGPQQTNIVKNYVKTLQSIIRDLHNSLISPPLGLEDRINAMTLSGATSPEIKIRKWFSTCLEQLEKAGDRVIETLPDEDSTTDSDT